ncbi:OmpA family protein [Corallococcus carmarthensis]|uniref:OmpA family protein n=1 Tax=Corallococcus carmarthensis TaxID=2316728 RepID=UPI00148D258F|nr:OmpA family protein [Corallococcus carmarthensis]NOK21793.1 OmpA family protein [Corallococcus carmarthensis]
MAFNLIEAVGSQFMQKGLLQKISGSLGEDPQATTKALPGAIAAVAAGVADQGGNEAGAHRLLSKLNEGGFTGPDAPERQGGVGEGLLDEEERGKGMLSGIFGNKLGGVTEGLTRFGGMRNAGSATRLLSLAAPMLMGVLGKQVRDQRMGSSGLMQLLNGQRNNIAAALPAGLGGILGFGGGRHAVAEVIEPHRETVTQVRETGPVREAHTVRETTSRQTLNRPPERKKSIAGWAIPLALLALVVLAWGALRGRREERRAPQVSRTTPRPEQNRVAQAPQPTQPAPATPPAAPPQATQPTQPATGGAGTVDNQGTGGAGTEPSESANMAQDAGTGGSGTQEQEPAGATKPEEGGTGGSGQEKMRASDPNSLREAFEGPGAAQGFVLEGVEFKTGSSQLTSKSKRMVGELGNVLKEKTDTRVRIKGFTDSTGNPDTNRQLSETRAESVRSALVRDGVPEDRIEVSGEGDADPIASNDNPQGRVQNRRIEVQVLGQ